MKNLKKQVEDLQHYIDTEKVMYASCYPKPNKSLYIDLKGNIEVVHNGKIVLITMQPFDAIEKYNKIK